MRGVCELGGDLTRRKLVSELVGKEYERRPVRGGLFRAHAGGAPDAS